MFPSNIYICYQVRRYMLPNHVTIYVWERMYIYMFPSNIYICQQVICIGLVCADTGPFAEVLWISAQEPCISAKEPYISAKRALYIRKRALYICKRALYIRERALHIRKRAQHIYNETQYISANICEDIGPFAEVPLDLYWSTIYLCKRAPCPRKRALHIRKRALLRRYRALLQRC